MEKYTLKIGSFIKSESDEYVILNLTEESIILCKRNTSKLEITSVSPETMASYIRSDTVTVVNSNETSVCDTSQMTEKQSEKYKLRKAIIKDFEDTYGPNFMELNKLKSANLKSIYEKHHIPKASFFRLIRTYLQSGRDITSLIPTVRDNNQYNYKNKPGRPSTVKQGIPLTNEVIAQFEYGISEYKKGRKMTKHQAYLKVIEKYYTGFFTDDFGNTVFGTFPIDRMPTEYQFIYYLNKAIPKYKQVILETSAQEYRNNFRPLYSDSLDSVIGPCDVWEMDECEIDIKLVSEKNRALSGLRPILYLMIDVFTKMVVGFSISYENNSVIGLTNCFLSLLDDKVKLCKDAGIPVPDYFWPSLCLPNKIRTDYGSEYVSDNVQQIFSDLNITHDFAPPGTGSLKGQVEQFFHQMHVAQNPLTEGNGLITKRHDSKHNTEAVMTITEFRKFALMFIIEHNATHMKDYPLSAEMMESGMLPCPTPYQIWDFGTKRYGMPRPIININAFKYSLLTQINASISRMGITYKGLHYADPLNRNLDLMLRNALNKRIPFPVRMDTRDLSCVYYIENGKLVSVPLSQRTDSAAFKGWSLTEYLSYKKLKLEAEKLADQPNMVNEIVRNMKQKEILAEAKRNKVETQNAKNIRERRI